MALVGLSKETPILDLKSAYEIVGHLSLAGADGLPAFYYEPRNVFKYHFSGSSLQNSQTTVYGVGMIILLQSDFIACPLYRKSLVVTVVHHCPVS
jgi:hypothetical protein